VLPIGAGLPAAEAANFALASFSSFGEMLAEAGNKALNDARRSLTARPTIPVNNVKLFCSRCKGQEVFSPVWCAGIDAQPSRTKPAVSESVGGFQLFVLGIRVNRMTPRGIFNVQNEWLLERGINRGIHKGSRS
jgi:hypothetical protein